MRKNECLEIFGWKMEFGCVGLSFWYSLSSYLPFSRLKFIGGDLRHEGRGIYFDGVLGLDKNIRLYVGQSTNIRFRIAQHLNFRYRRDNPSLHYHAIHKSIFNVLGILAIVPPNSIGNHALPGMDCPDLLLNLLEMWMCLVFRCLPQQTLNTWLPQDVGRSSNFGALNIASPLDSGSDEREWVDLSQWNDPLVQEYLGMSRRKTYTKWTKEEEEEELEEEPKREVVGRESKQVVSEHNVIQISTPTLVLAGAAVLTGFLLLRSGIGPERR
jgi:hypothetical protein